MGTYRQVPAFIIGLLVPRGYPEGFPGGYEDDLVSLAFAFENLMLAAREEGLGSVPITAFHRWEKDRLREILGIPAGDRPGDREPHRLPRVLPHGPRAGAEAQLPHVALPGPRRPVRQHARVARRRASSPPPGCV